MTSTSAAVSLRPAGLPARSHPAGWPSAPAPAIRAMPAAPVGEPLPEARRVLGVIARPGQESADLGALVYAFGRGGASLALLRLARGEAASLNSPCPPLETVRLWELHAAAWLRV